VNKKINTPQADVVPVDGRPAAGGRRVEDSDVTVLEGATPGSVGSASGSSGPIVPGH
jgi:hypothetical protein